MKDNATPMIRQYLAVKKQYPDVLLFYRMGDFYEMFFEDAKVASRILEITLTSRNKNEDKAIPMCGVPYRAVQGYIAKIIAKGMKVAICDQVEDAALAKGLVKREVVRVITPGMIVENEFLDAKTENYILAITKFGKNFGLACLDISTGTFRICESEQTDSAKDEILRISPSEILLPDSFHHDPDCADIADTISGKSVTYLADRYFDYAEARERLTAQFKTLSLEGFGCEHLRAGTGAAGAVLYYVADTQKQQIEHLRGMETYHIHQYLAVDEASCRNLEIMQNLRNGTRQGTLLDVMDQTVTSMGGRRLRHWLRYPLRNTEEIQTRLDAVQEALENMNVCREVRELLSSVYDLERLGTRILMGHASARDMTALKKSLFTFPEIANAISAFQCPLYAWKEDLVPLRQLADLIEKSIREDAPPTLTEGGIIKSGYHPELDELMQISRDGKGWLARLEAQERQATGIASIKVRYNKVFGYYLEIPRTHSEKVPANYIRKQTLVNAERYITDELKNFETKVLNAEDRRMALEYEIFNEIREAVRKEHPRIHAAATFIARLDCLLSLAHIAEQNNYCRPEIRTDGQLHMEDGRHPVIEKMITAERFVPNTLHMDSSEHQVLIITGPNMAGKSTVLRQAALLTVMAQAGSFVPAAKAEISLTDRIFTRVGALDNLSQGQSTFMVEMQETANILNNATPDSLVILDEIGRGTSTFDGMSIAWAVAEYLHDLKGKGVKTLFATHYHELTELAREKKRVKNYNIAVKEVKDEIIFLRKLVEGGTNRSYGIQVARLAGIPDRVIDRAKKILAKIESKANGVAKTPSGIREEKEIFGKRALQMDLFNPEQYLAEKIGKLDISNLTPVDALNILHRLQEKIRSN
ncbi:MAG: DNA mismatch repair protein MutS [Desulfobacterales bacterium]